jgi:O-antigen ligase
MISTGRPGDGRRNWVSFAIAGFVALAILFGGGGAEGQPNNGIIFGLSAVLLFSLLAAHWTGLRPLPAASIIPVLLLVAFLTIGALQLVPMQASNWRSLPGHQLAASALNLVGAGTAARPSSLDPEATRRSMAALLLPAAIMVAVLGASRREVYFYVVAIIAAALVSTIIGALQLGLGYPRWLTYYDGANAGAASGVFANVNHHAALLLAAIVCVGIAVRMQSAAAAADRRRRNFHPAWLLVPLFAVIVFATGSRAALLLLVLAVPASAIIGFGRTSAKLLIVALLAVGLGIFLLSEIMPAGTDVAVGQSFAFSQDRRYAILPDVIYTLRQYWPAGSGLGTFAQVFAVNEDLDIAGYAFVNHAHNDVLELLLESGIAGLLLAIAAVVAVGARVLIVQLRDPSGRGERAPFLWGGFFILALLALHSLADYPLRTPAIAAVAGAALGLLFVPARQARRKRPGARAIAIVTAAGVLGLLIGGETFRMYAAEAAVRSGHGAEALQLDPANGAALALAAEEQLVQHHNVAARSLAIDAIRHAPLSPRAMRVLAMAQDLDHRSGVQAWRLASEMGWRDPATQFWAMQQALLNREFGTAAIRADALLRTSVDANGERVGAIRALAGSAPFRAELIKRLQLEPVWAAAFFAVRTKAPEEQIAGAAATLADLANAGAPVTPRQARATIQALIDRKQFSAAIDLDRHVARRAAENIGSIDFDDATDHYVFDVTPFDWNIAVAPGAVVSVEQSENRRVLILGTDGRKAYQPVRRYLALAPGEYSLGYAMRGSRDAPAVFGISVACAASSSKLASSSAQPLEGADFEHREMRFQVPASCPLVLVSFNAAPGDSSVDVQFADLTLGAA